MAHGCPVRGRPQLDGPRGPAFSCPVLTTPSASGITSGTAALTSRATIQVSPASKAPKPTKRHVKAADLEVKLVQRPEVPKIARKNTKKP